MTPVVSAEKYLRVISAQCIFCEQQEEDGGRCCCCWWDCSTNVWWVVDWCQQQQQQLGPVSVQPMAGCLCHNHDHHRLHNVHSQLAYVRILTLTSHHNLSTASKKQQLFWFNVNVNGSQQLQGLLDPLDRAEVYFSYFICWVTPPLTTIFVTKFVRTLQIIAGFSDSLLISIVPWEQLNVKSENKSEPDVIENI